MLEDIGAAAQKLIRKHFARSGKFEDGIARLWMSDDGGRSKLGEKARRMLANSERVSNYPEKVIEALETDRAMTLKELDGPLALVMGGLATLEIIDARIDGLKRVLAERWRNQSDVTRQGYYRQTIPLIEALFDAGIPRGEFTALSETEIATIAQYIKRKVAARSAELPPLHPNGPREHAFWKTYALPVGDAPEGWAAWLKKQRESRRRRKI